MIFVNFSNSENTECVENGEEKVVQEKDSQSEGGEKSSTGDFLSSRPYKIPVH